MRLGPKEKQVLRALVPGEFVPPSVYMQGHNSCPSGWPTLNRLVHVKKLAKFRYDTQTPEERMRVNSILTPGYEASEYNAALIPTKKGEEIIRGIK